MRSATRLLNSEENIGKVRKETFLTANKYTLMDGGHIHRRHSYILRVNNIIILQENLNYQVHKITVNGSDEIRYLGHFVG